VLANSTAIKGMFWSPATVVSPVVLLETEAQRLWAMWGQEESHSFKSNDTSQPPLPVQIIEASLSIGFSQIPPCNAILLPSGASSKAPRIFAEEPQTTSQEIMYSS